MARIPLNDPRAKSLFDDYGKRTTKNVLENLETAGVFLEGKMAEKISSNIAPALKEETVRRKGSSQTLIDKGQLLGQITHNMNLNSVEVGVFGSRAGIAAHHEFGAPSAGIPERSFMRSSFNENKDQLKKIVEGK